MKFAEIAIPLPIYQTYTYDVPSDLESSILPGYRVVVPLGERKITGYVISIQDESPRSDLKPIYDLLDDSPALQPDLLALASWISTYYICPIGEVIKAMLPAGINLESNIYIELIKTIDEVRNYIQENRVPTQEKILNLLLEHKNLAIQDIRKRIRGSSLSFSITRLIQAGLLSQEVVLSQAQTKPKYETWIRIPSAYSNQLSLDEEIEKLSRSAPAQAACLKTLAEHREISQKNLLQKGGGSSKIISTLVELSSNNYKL